MLAEGKGIFSEKVEMCGIKFDQEFSSGHALTLRAEFRRSRGTLIAGVHSSGSLRIGEIKRWKVISTSGLTSSLCVVLDCALLIDRLGQSSIKLAIVKDEVQIFRGFLN